MHFDLCLCGMMPRFDLKTRIILIMQWGEHGVISNTGHLIPKIFNNAELRYRGHYSRIPLDLGGLDDGQTDPYVLFPLGGAGVLDEAFVKKLERPLTLIIPDGNWGQAARMVKKNEALLRLPKLALPSGPPSAYRLRLSPRADGVCTFEAVARALGLLEGARVQKELEGFFTVMIERMLWTRSKIRAEEVTGGIRCAR
ncbi:MAG: DTW domain-containing protein [Deltaproteobacteria bacterium]|nr:DTW domain-containing protein [Deltaproteobacteria bacterium]